jgi:flagellar biosynthesis protein FlhA
MNRIEVNSKIWTRTAKSAILPVGILMLVLLMVVPIPAFMLDMFFITNIMISLAVLMVALNAQKPLDFSAFPTVLLFATLFRLASTSPRRASCWSTAMRAKPPPAMSSRRSAPS